MKRNRLIVAMLLAMTMVFSALAFTACSSEDAHKCEHICPECQKCMSDCTDDVCKDKCQGHEETVDVDMTQGIYFCKMGNYELIIKFYDDETYYFQNEQEGFRGKYEIKDESIMFSRSQEDGSDYNSEEHPNEAKWLSGNKVIYFYQEDGTTPVDYVMNASEQTAHSDTVVKGTCYAYGTKPNTLAYNTETDQIQSFKGNYGSRTLSHVKERDFTINNEKPIEQAKYMVKNLPDGAEAGKVESDYFLLLSQKGYESNIPALEAWELTNGKFTTSDDTTYVLTDTISGATATLTVAADGKTATVTKGEDTVELVLWADVMPYAAEVKGSALDGKVQVTVRFNEDGTLTIFGSTKNYSGNYKAAKDGTITVSDVDSDSPVTIDSASFVTADDVTTLTAQLTIATGNSQMPTVFAEAEGSLTGKLFGLEAVTVLEAESKEAVFGDTVMKLEMKDDCTLVISVGGQPKVTSSWSLDMQTKQISFNKTSSGALAFTLASPANITWTGKLSDTETEDRTYTFEFEATELGNLTTAKVGEKYATTVQVAKLGNQDVTLTFMADGTLTVANPRMMIATGEWELTMDGGIPSLTFTNISSGTMTGTLASDYTVTWNGAITTQQGSVEVEIAFVFPSSDLANLM